MWQVGSTCFSTKTAALQAAVSAQVGTVVQQGGQPHAVTVTAVAQDGVEYTLQPLAGGVPIVTQVAMEPQPCALLSLADGQMIAWAIAAGWLSIYGIKALLHARPEE